MHVEEKESVTIKTNEMDGKMRYHNVHVPVRSPNRGNVMVSIEMKEKMKGESHTLTHTDGGLEAGCFPSGCTRYLC